MNVNKPWYLSRTIWASIVMLGATLASAFGLVIDEGEASALTDAILQAVAAVAGLVAIFGRLSAKARIG